MREAILGGLILALSAAAAELPVRQVILYKHGIGFFERSGQLGPGESARLDFKATEMNDVLKSLTLVERGGGKISGLRYDSMDLLGAKLAEFPFKLGEAQPLSGVLDQLKGARLELQLGTQTVAGAIVSGRLVAADEKHPEREQVTLLLDSGELHTLDLNAASSVRFTDAKLQQQFRDYLQTLTAARSREKRSVYIDSTDAKAREVVATYTIPTAVWKSSYRLVLDANASILEGWAIVDNTTGEDWNKITLALVSGRPISFISALYPPRFVNRPTAELPEDRAVGPVIHEGAFSVGSGVAAGAAPDALSESPSAGLRQFAAGRLMAPKAMPAPAAAPPPPVQSTVVNEAMAQAVGDLFEYRLPQPVTIRKNESAMLPFLQQKIDARKLLIYADRSTGHPTNAAELTNATGKTLDGGPITVYDGGTYAGEALMETLKSGDKRLISYAVDLGTRITEAFGSNGEVVRELHAVHGILTTRIAAEETRTYTIRNVDSKPKTLILEHPLRPSYNLLNQKPAEKTSTAYRFEVKLASGATETFPVAEERVYEQTYMVGNLGPDALLVYVRNKAISETGRKQLEHIVDRKNALADTDQQIKDVQLRITAATNDEERLRKNIESLSEVSGQQQQVQDYARKLAAQETQLATLRDHQAELQTKRSELESEINKLIAAMTF